MSEEEYSSGSTVKKSEATEEAAREKEEAKKREFERIKRATRPRRHLRNAPSKFRD
jgi:hypothetical protein